MITTLFLTFNEDLDEDENLDENENNSSEAAPTSGRATDFGSQSAAPQLNWTRRQIRSGTDYIVYRIEIPYYNDPGVNRTQNRMQYRVQLSVHRRYVSVRFKNRYNDETVYPIPIPYDPGVNRMKIRFYQEYLSIRFQRREDS